MNYIKKGVVIPFMDGKKKSIATEYTKLDNFNEQEDTKELNEILSLNDKMFINMSHELKTPLNVIFSAAQLMEISLTSDDGSNKDILRNIDHIKKNCYRLIKVINNLVEMHKISLGSLKLNISEEDIVEITRYIVQASSELIDDLGLKIYFYTNINKKIMSLDRVRIEKVLLNLISNAIKFSKPGSHINVSVVDREDYVKVSVKDDGIGIEEKDLQNLFIGYEQVDKSLSRVAEGTGVGLFLVKSFIEMHGGSVKVKSMLDKGTEFIFKIPYNYSYESSNSDKVIMQESKDELVQIEFSDIPKSKC